MVVLWGWFYARDGVNDKKQGLFLNVLQHKIPEDTVWSDLFFCVLENYSKQLKQRLKTELQLQVYNIKN